MQRWMFWWPNRQPKLPQCSTNGGNIGNRLASFWIFRVSASECDVGRGEAAIPAAAISRAGIGTASPGSCDRAGQGDWIRLFVCRYAPSHDGSLDSLPANGLFAGATLFQYSNSGCILTEIKARCARFRTATVRERPAKEFTRICRFLYRG